MIDRMNRMRGLSAALLATVLSLAAVNVLGDARASYKEGQQAVEESRWADAERALRAAIAERGEERVSSFRRYLPFYYLGTALAAQGDCRGALEAWATSESQGAIQKTREYTDMREGQSDCQGILQALDVARDQAQKAIDAAEADAGRVAPLASDPTLAATWNQGGSASLKSRRAAAGKRLDDARTRLHRGYQQGDTEVMREAQQIAGEVSTEYRAIVRAARQKVEEFNAVAAEAQGQLEEVEESAGRMLSSLGDLKPYPRQLGTRVAAVEQLLTEVAAAKGTAKPEALEDLREQLTVAQGRLRRSATRPPQKLADAVEAFFEGEYHQVIETLESPRFRDPRSLAHTCLLRAASWHAIWVFSGEQDVESGDAAAAEVRACDEQTGTLEPQTRYFSPRFIEFYQATLAAPPADEIEGAEGADADVADTEVADEAVGSRR